MSTFSLTELVEMHEALSEQIRKLEEKICENDWRHLANRKLKFLAIIACRRQNDKVTLCEAKEKVESFMAMG